MYSLLFVPNIDNRQRMKGIAYNDFWNRNEENQTNLAQCFIVHLYPVFGFTGSSLPFFDH